MKYICKICGKEYNTKNALRSHLRRKHGWSFEKIDSRLISERVIRK
ncbi:C2H2-type zinc finger protein [Acidianus ambivalens]|uniref:C2H2-type domain-containing protein n=1 Tax=Acidianus ambivalens TaxID=2283 RepID=A0A650CTG1_ACIAM|nr:hypothetical protein [Acidianus ambivalens]QGR21073.1 hypothetical protein D1866_02830 [Acidianus ambivalens]